MTKKAMCSRCGSTEDLVEDLYRGNSLISFAKNDSSLSSIRNSLSVSPKFYICLRCVREILKEMDEIELFVNSITEVSWMLKKLYKQTRDYYTSLSLKDIDATNEEIEGRLLKGFEGRYKSWVFNKTSIRLHSHFIRVSSSVYYALQHSLEFAVFYPKKFVIVAKIEDKVGDLPLSFLKFLLDKGYTVLGSDDWYVFEGDASRVIEKYPLFSVGNITLHTDKFIALAKLTNARSAIKSLYKEAPCIEETHAPSVTQKKT